LAVVSSLVAFVVVSLLAFLVALHFIDGIIWPVVIGIFCGFAAWMLNVTDVMARWSRREPTSGEAGGRDDQRENGHAP
jgi:hypothetical protein